MSRYKIVLAMRSNAFPHVDTLATYRLESESITLATNAAIRRARREGMPVDSVRRVTVSLARAVTP